MIWFTNIAAILLLWNTNMVADEVNAIHIREERFHL